MINNVCTITYFRCFIKALIKQKKLISLKICLNICLDSMNNVICIDSVWTVYENYDLIVFFVIFAGWKASKE